MDDVAKLKQRLCRLERARDKWKARAAAKQERIRALVIKARDLALSRDRWKDEACRQDPAVPPLDDPPRLLPMPPALGRSLRGEKAGHGRG